MIDEFEGVSGLCAAIIAQAVIDYQKVHKDAIPKKQRKYANEEELQKFFESDWFEELCCGCGLRKEVLLQKLNKTLF